MADFAFSEGKVALGAKALNLGTDTIKLVLVTDAYTPSAAHAYSDVSPSEVAAGGNYTTGGQAITTQSWAANSGNGKLASDNVTWGSSTITARYGVLYDTTASKLLRLIDFGSNQSSVNGNFSVQTPANGWDRII